MLLSIIVPVLNIEKYIARCLDSIMPACSDDCEIILVTGDSSDNSNKICENYQMAFPNIRVLRQAGKGLSNARNCAMDIAIGKYISFIDGDDYVDTEVYKTLLENLRSIPNEVDLIVTDFSRVTTDGSRIRKIYQIGEDCIAGYDMRFLPYMLRKKHCFWNVWRFIFHRIFLEENDLRFIENKYSEDIDFTTKALLSYPRMLFIHYPFYYYNVGRRDSLMDQPTYRQLNDTVDILCSCIRLLESSSYVYSQILIGQFQYEYILNLAILNEIAKEDRKKAHMLYKATLDILLVGSDRLAHFVRGLLKIIPLTLLSEVLHILKFCRRFINRGPRKIKAGGNNLDDNHQNAF